MDQNLEKKLAAEYPFMRRRSSLAEQKRKTGMISDLYGAFGCEMGNGWYELMRGLCGEITKAYQEAGVPVDIVVDQVKEKYGTLRFYYHFEGNGGVRIYPDGNGVHSKIAGIVERWEERSATLCEECGRPAQLREDLPWIRTLCDFCYGNIKKNHFT